jgi:biopolymer transport protein ExbD
MLLEYGCSDKKSYDNTDITIKIKGVSLYEVNRQALRTQVELNDFFNEKISKKHDRNIILQGLDEYPFADIKPILTNFASMGLCEIAFRFSSENNQIFYLELPFGGTRTGKAVKVAVFSKKYRINGGQPISFEELKKTLNAYKTEVVWIDLSLADDIQMKRLVKFFKFISSTKLRLAWNDTSLEPVSEK